MIRSIFISRLQKIGKLFIATATSLLICITAQAQNGREQSRVYNDLMDKIMTHDRVMDQLVDDSDVMTKDIAVEAYAHYVGSFALIEEIVKSELEEELKAKLAGKMLGEISRNLFKYMRHLRDDRNPDGRVSLMTMVKRTAIEIFSDYYKIFYFPRAADGSFQWGWLEEKRRSDLVENVIRLFDEKMGELKPYVNVSADGLQLEEYFWGQYHYVVDRAVNIRMERDAAEQWARLFYIVSGTYFFIQPEFAYTTGPMLDFWSGLEAGVINVSVFWTMALIKNAKSSLESTRQWISLHDKLVAMNDPEFTEMLRGKLKEHFPREYHKPHISNVLRFEMKARKKYREWTDSAKSKIKQVKENFCAKVLSNK